MLRGEVIADHMRREGLDQETLEAALREHGVADLSNVEVVVLEIDGSISVVPAGGTTKRVKRPVKYLRHQCLRISCPGDNSRHRYQKGSTKIVWAKGVV